MTTTTSIATDKRTSTSRTRATPYIRNRGRDNVVDKATATSATMSNLSIYTVTAVAKPRTTYRCARIGVAIPPAIRRSLVGMYMSCHDEGQ